MLKATWTDWNDSFEQDVKTWRDALPLITNLAKEHDLPRIVEFYCPVSGRSLAMGVGRNHTVLTYQDSLDPPYFLSLGDAAASGVEWFCYGNERTEYSAENLVPLDKGLEALRCFVDNGKRSDIVKWVQL